MTASHLPVLAAVAGLAAAAVLVWPSPRRPAWTPGRWWHPRARRGTRPGRGPWSAAQAGLVPEALELIALALVGGGSLASAVTWVGEVLPGEPAEELTRVAGRLREGLPSEEAWADAGPRWAAARRSLRLAEVAGVPPGEALTRAAGDLRRDAVRDVEVASARLGVRLVLPLGLAYLPAFVLTTVVPVVLALTRDLVW